MKTIQVAVQEAAMKAAGQLTLSLRDYAVQAGWPSDVIIQMSVIAVDGDLKIDYPAALSSQVEDLEYGNQNTPPAPVIRPFEARFEREIGEMMSGEYLDALYDMGAFN